MKVPEKKEKTKSKLRDKYLYRLLTWGFNMHKDMLLEEAAKYKELDLLAQQMLLRDAEKLGQQLVGIIEKQRKKKIAVKEKGKKKN